MHSRWFAASVSLWAGAIAVATAYDGPAASGGIAALLAGGVLWVALWRRRIVARVRNVDGAVTAAAASVGVLVIGLLGARAFEVYGLSWLPFATGGVVAAALFVALEVLRRATRARAAGCP